MDSSGEWGDPSRVDSSGVEWDEKSGGKGGGKGAQGGQQKGGSIK